MSSTDTQSDRQRQSTSSRDAALRRLFELCASDPHVAELVRHSVDANASRIVDDYHRHSRMMSFEPWWLLQASQQILRALKPAK